ncbi:MAG: hypothetical protein KJN71_09075 [Acidimicrobiia bacterium]|nr:hypothetical protein [Acidimicrobiia bacterium]
MNIWQSPPGHVAIAALLLLSGCTDDGPQTADSSAVASTIVQTNPATEATTASSLDDGDSESSGSNRLAVLPTREGPRKETTGSVPHIQVGTEPVPAVDAELRRRVFLIPGIEERESQISLPGARSLWLAEELELARPEVLQVGREFGHFHPDGSLHLWMPVDRAQEVEATKWGELHPWVDRDDYWDGIVMIYIPETADDADIALQLVVDTYNNIVGTNLDPASVE